MARMEWTEKSSSRLGWGGVQISEFSYRAIIRTFPRDFNRGVTWFAFSLRRITQFSRGNNRSRETCREASKLGEVLVTCTKVVTGDGEKWLNLDIFWRSNQYDLLIDQMWYVREERRMIPRVLVWAVRKIELLSTMIGMIIRRASLGNGLGVQF